MVCRYFADESALGESFWTFGIDVVGVQVAYCSPTIEEPGVFRRFGLEEETLLELGGACGYGLPPPSDSLGEEQIFEIEIKEDVFEEFVDVKSFQSCC